MKTKLLLLSILLLICKIGISQDLVSGGTNSWLFHTPDDGRTTMWIAPKINDIWNFTYSTEFLNNGAVNFSGTISTKGNICATDYVMQGSNSWIMHSPDDGRTTLFIAPKVNNEWAWGKSTQFSNNGNVFFSGNVGIGTIEPVSKLDVNGGVNVSGMNAIGSVNGFNNKIQFTNSGSAAIVYNPGQTTELMFGFHSNGNFYWGTGQNATTPNYYSMWLNGNNGNLGIKGKLTANEVEVKVGGWADFVFAPDYPLISLEDLEQYIKTHKHLPDVPSEKEVKENGLSLGQSDAVLLQKIEELTLYLIEMNKTLKAQNEKIDSQNNKIIDLEKEIQKLKLTK